MNDAEVILEGDELTVALHRDLPLLRGYVHRRSGRTFGAGAPGGRLRINGADQSWDELDIAVRAGGGERRYTVTVDAGLSFDIVFALRGSTLQVRLDNIDDARTPLASLEWIDLPLLTCADSGFRCYRLFTTDPDPEAMGKMWLRDAHADIAGADTTRFCPASGCVSTLAECEEIIRAFHGVTDGLPQAAFLVGVESQQPEGAYPSMDRYNENLGPRTELYRLAARCKEELNALVSYHANIDDAHRSSKDFDPALVGVRYHPGGTVFDEEKTNFDDRILGGMSHTRDVESGAIFRRFEGMMRTVPVEGTIHLDNLRITNCDPRSDPEGIGILEELVCGLMPIVAWLRERGISVSTEGYNGLPADPARLVSAFWHHDPRDSARQIYHRKIMGGGRGDHYGGGTTADYGICKSFHQDITYHPISVQSLGREAFDAHFPWLAPRTRLTLSFEEDWQEIVERIYLGSLLNLFYLQHEMLAWDDADGGVLMRFAGGIRAEVGVGSPERLLVTWNDVVVADGGDRFVPLGDGVHCYSRHGCRRAWLLPPALRGRPLELFTLSAAGRGAAPEHRLQGDRLTLALAARVPAKVIAKEGS